MRIGGVFGTCVLLASMALVLLQAQDRAHQELEERFALRGSIAASFISAWVDDFARRETLGAEALLKGPRPSRKNFEELVRSQQLAAAVLLDQRGRALQVWPRNTELLGTNLAAQYPHLEQAVAGDRGVSNVVASAAEAVPVVAVAVPFDTTKGRRIFSGALEVAETPIGKSYLANITPISGSRVYLVDAFGKPFSTDMDEPDVVLDEDRDVSRLLSSSESGVSTLDDDIVNIQPIEGTPWRIAVVAPQDELFAPIRGWTFVAPWLTFAALVAAAASTWWLFEKLGRSRAALAESNATLVERNAQIEEAAAVQRRFISASSHELRTPLTSILGYLELANDAQNDTERQEALQVVERNARRLYSLVDNLMLVFRSEVEDFANDEVDLHRVFADSVDELKISAARRGIQLQLKGTAPLMVLGDRERLSQVADNLISNAIKYSLDGGAVEVVLETVESNAIARVADSGIGIPANELGRMFERFFRSSTARQARIGGTGLGLAITRAIVEKHGGRIDLSSVEGEGTTFMVELPLAEGGTTHGEDPHR